MKLRARYLLFLLLAIGLVAVALYGPISLPTNLDFSAIYNTDLALVQRVPIYDIPQVQTLAAQHAGIPVEQYNLARFPYPPWYALSTFYLGLMPPKAAATLWFELNLIMLFVSAWMLTDGWSRRMRLVALALAVFFLPVLGTLTVGQYDFPVLLGLAMLIRSMRKQSAAGAAAGMVLLSFKPHVGGLVLLAALGWLLVKRTEFVKRVLRDLLMAGGVLLVSGFLADPAWVVSYPKMLLTYQNEGNVATCSECASLPVWLSRWLFDGSLARAMWIALALLVVLLLLAYLFRSALKQYEFFLSAALLITLLASPYLYNYDYLLLLIPFALLIETGGRLTKLLVGVCYVAPLFAIALAGRAGNISLTLVTFALAGLVFWRRRLPEAGPASNSLPAEL